MFYFQIPIYCVHMPPWRPSSPFPASIRLDYLPLTCLPPPLQPLIHATHRYPWCHYVRLLALDILLHSLALHRPYNVRSPPFPSQIPPLAPLPILPPTALTACPTRKVRSLTPGPGQSPRRISQISGSSFLMDSQILRWL